MAVILTAVYNKGLKGFSGIAIGGIVGIAPKYICIGYYTSGVLVPKYHRGGLSKLPQKKRRSSSKKS
jgi:hypothetical protein